MSKNTAAKIHDIGRPFAQVLVVGRLERICDVLDGGLDGPFSIDLLMVDVREDPIAKLPVIQQGAMRVKDLRFRPTQLSLYTLLQTRQIVGATLERGLEAPTLFTGHRRCDPVMRNRGSPPAYDMRLASGQAG